MSYYEYYRLNFMRALRAAYALNYLFGGRHSGLRAGAGVRKETGSSIEEIPMRFVKDLRTQAAEIVRKRPQVSEDPSEWRTVNDVSAGVSNIERQLGYEPSYKNSLGSIRQALKDVVRNENRKVGGVEDFEV